MQGAALVRCHPKTGRTHQIRLHLAYLGHPLLGDEVYGVVGPWLNRQALHAAALEVTHPLTGKRMRFEAPMPDDFKRALDALSIEV
jgi:23S rRNA pseudouridine1911/1915/1917 synthase